MQQLGIKAYTIEEAKLKAYEQGITVISDATKAWIAEGSSLLPKQLEAFAMNRLDKDGLFSFQDTGIIIEIKKREKPKGRISAYLVNFPKKGPRKMNKTVEIRDIKTDLLLATAKNKKLAIKKAKEVVRNHETDIYAVTKYIPVDRDFEMYYHDHSDKFKGEYLVFYVDEKDVRLYKQRLRNF